MPFFDPSQPLGLPRGSIRALLTIMALAGGLYIALTVFTAPEWLVILLTMIIKDYFQARDKEGQEPDGEAK